MDDCALWGIAAAFQVDVIVFRAEGCENMDQFDRLNMHQVYWAWTKWSGPRGSLKETLDLAQPTEDDYSMLSDRWKKAIFLLHVGRNHFLSIIPPQGWRGTV